MRDRIKWMLVGLGFTFGLQVVISLIFTGIAFSAAARQSDVGQATLPLVVFGLTLGAFLIGSFVTGSMSEELRLADAVGVAVLTLMLCLLIYLALPEGNKGQFVTGLLTNDIMANPGRGLIFFGLAILASVVGAYLGWHVTVPEESALDRVALLIGLIGAVLGPFVLMAIGGRDPSRPDQQNLPWYFLAVVFLLVLIIIGVGFILFTRDSHYDEEISISPDTRREHSPQ